MFVPILILAVLAVVTVDDHERVAQAGSRGELRIDVTGELWWWRGELPRRRRSQTANEIYLPAGQPVDIRLTSDNVIHSFWVPQLAGKEDAIPGQTNHLRFTADACRHVPRRSAPSSAASSTRTCGSTCTWPHAGRLRALARTPATAARSSRRPSSIAAGQARVPARGVRGLPHRRTAPPRTGTIGPNLTDVGARTTLGAGAIENTPANMERWIPDAPAIKPGVLMPPFRRSPTDEVADIAAYLESLK